MVHIFCIILKTKNQTKKQNQVARCAIYLCYSVADLYLGSLK